jgi:hypothetical protein
MILDASNVIPLRYSFWVANLVPLRKKNEETQMCVNFNNLNRYLLKDNYPLPKMYHIFKKVVGTQIISMMDAFFYVELSGNEYK